MPDAEYGEIARNPIQPIRMSAILDNEQVRICRPDGIHIVDNTEQMCDNKGFDRPSLLGKIIQIKDKCLRHIQENRMITGLAYCIEHSMAIVSHDSDPAAHRKIECQKGKQNAAARMVE